MQRIVRQFGFLTFFGVTLLIGIGCQSGGSVAGNEGGSDPINEQESNEYKKAVVRCYKTGGTRVVKIMGSLKCY